MEWQWDKSNLNHIARHEVTSEEAEQVVEHEPFDVGVVLRNGERRTVHLGETDQARILVVIVTERDGMYRVVTARPADRKERAFYSRHKAAINEQNPHDP